MLDIKHEKEIEGRVESGCEADGEGARKRGSSRKTRAPKRARTESPHVTESGDANSEVSVPTGVEFNSSRSPSPRPSLSKTQQTSAWTPPLAQDTPPSTPPRVTIAGSLDMVTSPDVTTRSPEPLPDDDGVLNSDYEGSDAGSAEWYEEMGVLVREDETPEYSDDDCEPSDVNADEPRVKPPAADSGESPAASPDQRPPTRSIVRTTAQPAPRLDARHLSAAEKKRERERWRDAIDNWCAIEGDDLVKLANGKAALKKLRVDGWETDPSRFPARDEFPGLYAGEYGPSQAALACAESPLELFLFFLPRDFWLGVERQTNRYYKQEFAGRMNARLHAQSGEAKLTLDQIVANEKRVHKQIRAHEILQCMGLLLARMLCPHSRRLSDHWATTSVGAIPSGTFGRFMKRERFQRIMRNLNFSDNTAAAAARDKAWKVRPIVDTMQRTFRSGYRTPPVISFDEVMVPSRSRHNPMRQFIKDKPHRWGTKLFVSCCAQTTYCLRMEVYCGKSAQGGPNDEDPADDSSGPAATLRNMNEVLPPKQDGMYYAVVTDRFTRRSKARSSFSRGMCTRWAQSKQERRASLRFSSRRKQNARDISLAAPPSSEWLSQCHNRVRWFGLITLSFICLAVEPVLRCLLVSVDFHAHKAKARQSPALRSCERTIAGWEGLTCTTSSVFSASRCRCRCGSASTTRVWR